MNFYSRKIFLTGSTPRSLVTMSIVLCLFYFVILTFASPPGVLVLFVLLILGEIFHVWQAIAFLVTIPSRVPSPVREPSFLPRVDVFITVAGESRKLVRQTIRAALAMNYPNFHIFVLNDGFVTQQKNWRAIERLSEKLGVTCITRAVPGGAKAGNVNHALERTSAPYIAIFDADHVPYPQFLQTIVPYFIDAGMGFVQTPQFYRNAGENETTRGAWEQQTLFYGPICRGKNAYNAATLCGTNMVIAREALEAVGGMWTQSIAEDLMTGLLIHEKGYSSYYHAEVLAEGLAPADFLSYSKQQFRWARGALDVLFTSNLFARRGLTFWQKMQYAWSATYFFSGVVVVFNMLLPLLFLWTGLIPLRTSGMMFALIFVPYIVVILTTLSRASNGQFTFRALSFGVSNFWIQLQALYSAVFRRPVAFTITPKYAVAGNYLKLVAPHLCYVVLIAIALPMALAREGFSASVVNNLAWACFNIGVFIPCIRSAAPALTPLLWLKQSAKQLFPWQEWERAFYLQPKLSPKKCSPSLISRLSNTLLKKPSPLGSKRLSS